PALSPDVAKWYWVRGADSSGEGIASIPVGGNNQPPVISLAESGFSGAPPFSLHFDASASTDPEGQPLEFVWVIPQLAASSGPVIDPQFPTEGIFIGVLFAIDEMGAQAEQEFVVTSTLGEKWRTVTVDSGHTLSQGDRVRIESLDSLAPFLGYSSHQGST